MNLIVIQIKLYIFEIDIATCETHIVTFTIQIANIENQFVIFYYDINVVSKLHVRSRQLFFMALLLFLIYMFVQGNFFIMTLLLFLTYMFVQGNFFILTPTQIRKFWFYPPKTTHSSAHNHLYLPTLVVL